MHLHAFPCVNEASSRKAFTLRKDIRPADRAAALRNEARHRQSFRTFGKTCRDCHVIAMIRLIRRIIVADDACIEFTVTLRKTMKSRHQPTHKKRALVGQRERLALLSAQNLLNPQRINSKAGCNRQRNRSPAVVGRAPKVRYRVASPMHTQDG